MTSREGIRTVQATLMVNGQPRTISRTVSNRDSKNLDKKIPVRPSKTHRPGR